VRVVKEQRAEMAAVDVAMGKAQAAMGRFEGSLVNQSDFIQDHMPNPNPNLNPNPNHNPNPNPNPNPNFIQDQMPAAVEKLTALMQQCDEVMRLSLQEDPASEAKVRARARVRVKVRVGP